MNAADSLRYRAAAARRTIYHAAAARNAALKAQAELTEGNACSVATLNQLNRAITSLENASRLAEQAQRRWLRKAARKADANRKSDATQDTTA